jgi:hypothetical protein
MKIVLLAIACCAGAGCSMDKAIELRLRMPTGDSADIDIGCVQSVEVLVAGHGVDDIEWETLDLDTPPADFGDIQDEIAGEFQFDLPPSGLLYVELRGTSAPDGFGDAIFYGGAHYEPDSDEMVIPLAANLDCANRMMAPMAIKQTDFMALVQTPAGAAPQCTPYPDAASVDFGTLRPTLMPMPCLGTWFDFPGTTTPMTPDGVALVQNAFTSAEGTSCLAIGERISNTVSCVYPGMAGICSQTELEVGLLDFDTSSASVDFDALESKPGVVFGTVWDSTAVPKRPIMNATVEILEGDGEVRYTDLNGIQFVWNQARTATGDRGLFMLYLAEPVRIRITAPGKGAKDFSVGGMAPSTLIATF